jgi:tetratricopeptide (TPR) repeat protein
MGLIIVIIILGLAIGVAMFFIVRNLVAPKKIARVETLLKQRKYAAAAKTAKQLLIKDPRNPVTHYYLGEAYVEDGKPELALMEFRTVNEIGNFEAIPETSFRKEMATLFARYNQPDEALKEYLLLIQKNPNDADNYYNAGTLFERRNKAVKAVNYYRKTIELKPGFGMAHLRLGSILYRAKKFKDAEGYLEKALRFEPDHYEAYYYLGRIRKENKDYAAALQAFEWSAKDAEFKVKSLIERGTCYMEMNNLERAVPELTRALSAIDDETKPEALWTHYFLATAYERLRKIEHAVEHWEAVYKHKPGFQDVAEKLSQYQELRQDDVLKDYLTASNTDFRDMCEKVTGAMGMSIQSVTEKNDTVQITAVDAASNWRTAKKQPKLIHFIRIAEMIEEATVREVHEQMRDGNVTRAYVVASSNFSRKAIDFAESRPIELVNKDKLQTLLKKAL